MEIADDIGTHIILESFEFQTEIKDGRERNIENQWSKDSKMVCVPISSGISTRITEQKKVKIIFFKWKEKLEKRWSAFLRFSKKIFPIILRTFNVQK